MMTGQKTTDFSTLYSLCTGGGCGLVRTLATCSLHEEASSEKPSTGPDARRVLTHTAGGMETRRIPEST